MSRKAEGFTFVFGDDWSALYEDGVLVHQGHEILPFSYSEALGVARLTADYEWLLERGDFPERLIDVKIEL